MEKNKRYGSVQQDVQQYEVIVKYGDKPLISCMTEVIRRLLIQSVGSQKGQ